MKYLFGPLLSRRLGRSLGIDLLPFKTCTLDCIYCECGCSDELTVARGEFVPTTEVVDELKKYLSDRPEIDYITFSGSGEPTLHSGIGAVIEYLKTDFPEYRVAVLTNSTLMNDEQVQRDILNADVVIPSLDAASENAFNIICKPPASVEVATIINGLTEFRKKFNGMLILEIFIVPGVNDTEEELILLKHACDRIQPDAVQLNTLDRPGCVDWIRVPTPEELDAIASCFEPFPVQKVIRTVSKTRVAPSVENPERDIKSLLARRPSTSTDIAAMLGCPVADVYEFIDKMINSGSIIEQKNDGSTFYKLNR